MEADQSICGTIRQQRRIVLGQGVKAFGSMKGFLDLSCAEAALRLRLRFSDGKQE
jgi:hypothetical protein